MFQVRLKELREKAGYTQKTLAEVLHVSQSTVGMWENGKNKPKNAKLEILANLFNVSTDYLLGRSDEEMPAVSDSGLDEEIVTLLSDLSPGEVQRVQDFVAGLKASRKE